MFWSRQFHRLFDWHSWYFIPFHSNDLPVLLSALLFRQKNETPHFFDHPKQKWLCVATNWNISLKGTIGCCYRQQSMPRSNTPTTTISIISDRKFAPLCQANPLLMVKTLALFEIFDNNKMLVRGQSCRWPHQSWHETSTMHNVPERLTLTFCFALLSIIKHRIALVRQWFVDFQIISFCNSITLCTCGQSVS